MSQHLLQFISQHRPQIEKALFDYLPLSRQLGAVRYNEALHYTTFPGGKRWRPLLTLLGGQLVGTQTQQLMPAACAIEYLHSSSMIIDDLPAMDDADIRRGKPSVHLAYDESTALLVSLGLMNHSYALLSLTCQNTGHLGMAGRLISQAANSIGSDGMIGGQVVDLELRSDCYGADTLESRNLKTTALMRLMMTAGAIASNADEIEISTLANYGDALGTAYQIYDDIIDELGECRTIGKPLNQDARHRRPNYVNQYGVVKAQRMAQTLINDGIESLYSQFGAQSEVDLLAQAANMIVTPLEPSVACKPHNLATLSCA